MSTCNFLDFSSRHGDGVPQMRAYVIPHGGAALIQSESFSSLAEEASSPFGVLPVLESWDAASCLALRC